MFTDASPIDLGNSWDRVSDTYHALQGCAVDTVYYGPLGPSEEEVGLLGNVAGQCILDIGCGGGQNCVALARQGARVSGVDISAKQLAYAQTLAAEHDVAVHLIQGDAQVAVQLEAESQDIVLCIYALHYMIDAGGCLAECWRLLRPGGQLIFSLDHPFRDCFYDEEEQEDTIFPVRSYFENAPMQWRFGDTGVPMLSNHRTLSQWLYLVNRARFILINLLEPCLPEEVLDKLWPEDHPFSPRRNIPHTVIVAVQKPQ